MKNKYFGIGIYYPKTEANVGSLFRSAYNFGASFLFTIGRRYTRTIMDTVDSVSQIPMYHYIDFDDFNTHRPQDCRLVCIERTVSSLPITTFCHFPTSIYLLGSEDNGIPPDITAKNTTIHLDTKQCINVSHAGTCVMFHRQLVLR